MLCQSPSATSNAAILTVIVTDPTGASIANAGVAFKGERDLAVKTSPDGSVQVPLPYGTYDITITSPGFKTFKAIRFPVDRAQAPLKVVLKLDVEHLGDDFSQEPLLVPPTTSDVPNVLQPNVERILVAGGPMKPLPVSSAPADCPKNQPKTEAALVELERSWAAALGRHDANTVACMLADEFEEADVDGSLHSRSEALAHIPQRKPGSNHLIELRVHVEGNFGYVRGLNEVQDPDGNVRARVRFTDVFSYRGGRWQAILGHESLIGEASR